ncbi:serine protease inhibitor 28Dc isoform X2 [Orussus abietinus]|uniref:serine protease inhibitor 28Dc isoform X2 n=1 Tax=Orussus abietinus TaxID=222816 RepID=UPI000624FA9D|nr:serine protease inhibitor 28Dc isoform X2 [Orussus abietinus]
MRTDQKKIMAMKTVVVLLGFLSLTRANLVFPDQLENMKTSTIHPYFSPAAAQAKQIGQFKHGLVPVVPMASTAFSSSVASGSSTFSLQQPWGNHVNAIITRGVEKFALDMNRAIVKTGTIGNDTNVIFAPLGLSGALALVLLGSAGRTFDEVSRILGLETGVDISKNSEIVHQMFGVLVAAVNAKDADNSTKPQTSFASGIFVQDGYPIRSEFRKISKDVYKSEVINLDFHGHPNEAKQTVNNWVKDRTMGKIRSILDDNPSPMTNVIIASALYFKGEWNQHFMTDATKRKPFTTSSGKIVEVDMMYNGGDFPFFEDKQLKAKIVGLPYKGREVTMYVVQPTSKDIGALSALTSTLSVDVLEHLIKSVKTETCILGLPRMNLSTTLSLNAALESLGLRSLFDAQTADLSLLSPGLNAPLQPVANFMQQSESNPLVQQLSSQDNFVFPRFRDDSDDKTPTTLPLGRPVRRNYFREAAGRLKRSEPKRKSAYEVPNITEGDDDARIKVVPLEENKYRFDRPRRSATFPKKRQVRPIDQDFLDWLNTQNYPSLGLDKLRNSGNLPNPKLFAENVLHKVEIEINERGTEAAAATAILLERDGSQKRLVADRPFLFFIRHEPSGLLLFWGTVNDPTSRT